MSPIVPMPPKPGALRTADAARYLGIGKTKLWELTSLGMVRKTSYGTYPIAELDRHLEEELKRKETT